MKHVIMLQDQHSMGYASHPQHSENNHYQLLNIYCFPVSKLDILHIFFTLKASKDITLLNLLFGTIMLRVNTLSKITQTANLDLTPGLLAIIATEGLPWWLRR